MKSHGRMSFGLVHFLALILVLSACTPPSDLRIQSIVASPSMPAEGEAVTFTITYHNSGASSVPAIQLDASYDLYLIFEKADPPASVDEKNRTLKWSLDGLGAGESKEVTIVFVIEKGFDKNIYQLGVNATISGNNSQGTPQSSSTSGNTYIFGQPIVMNFSSQGVEVNLPWQGVARFIGEPDSNDSLDSFWKEHQVVSDPSIFLIRPVIHFTVNDENGEPVYQFTPPMIITVNYTQMDIDKAKGDANKLTLLVFDHTTGVNKWVPYDTTIVSEKHTGTINITSWTSHICWGAR